MQQVFSLCSVVISSTLGRANVSNVWSAAHMALWKVVLFMIFVPLRPTYGMCFWRPLKGFADEDRSLYVFFSQGRLQRIIRGPAFEVTKCDAHFPLGEKTVEIGSAFFANSGFSTKLRIVWWDMFDGFTPPNREHLGLWSLRKSQIKCSDQFTLVVECRGFVLPISLMFVKINLYKINITSWLEKNIL